MNDDKNLNFWVNCSFKDGHIIEFMLSENIYFNVDGLLQGFRGKLNCGIDSD